jgi:hypothetical protein
MIIWPLIVLYGVGCAIINAVPWTLGLRAVIDATFVGAIARVAIVQIQTESVLFRRITKKNSYSDNR